MTKELFEEMEKGSEMDARVLNILLLCMRLKKLGHDCFFDYAPHVCGITVRVFLGERTKDKKADFNVTAYIDEEDYCYDEKELVLIESYLSELFENEISARLAEKTPNLDGNQSWAGKEIRYC